MKAKKILIVFPFLLLLQFSYAGIISRVSPDAVAFQKKANSVFTFFRTHRQTKDGITCAWGVSTGNNIISFKVLRTYEDPVDPYAVWETIGQVAYSGALRYKFTDPNVFPGFISYKIVAVMGNGIQEATEILTEHIISH